MSHPYKNRTAFVRRAEDGKTPGLVFALSAPGKNQHNVFIITTAGD